MSHLSNFLDTVLAIAFMEAVIKPVVVRSTKAFLKRADAFVDFIPDYLHSEKED